MKKRLLAATLGLAALATPYSIAQQYVDNSFIELNKLKYGMDLVAVGSINVNVAEKLTLKPDTVEFSIKYTTEGTTPSEASDRNTTNMKTLTSYLQQLAIKQKDLTTVGYKNYEKTSAQPLTKTDSQQYQTLLTVNVTIPSNKFYDVVKVLELQGISNLDKVKDTDNVYSFVISEIANSYDTTKQQAEKKYQTITEQLNTTGINQFTIEKYNNKEADQPTKEIKTYYVENTIKIRAYKFDDLGKIIAKAQELKMNVNNDFRYSVSDETKNKAIAELESKLLTKLQDKAKRSLSSGDYQLGAPQNLNISNSDGGGIYPRNYYAESDAMVNTMVMKSSAGAQVDIQPPSEFEIMVNMNGNFDIIKKVYKTN
ncbi:SIMPL domain-containing protein [Entomomonas asaccharolytica]|uniref:SIMPL domain-containing protein n=1 Tax=Entomomonas asaccharolytica TaxID=2785331 RepID=A0A974NEX5_9GAMM|nr:SIMPL domain-containing protein [Entomomonas asaccharolytica]QQP85283.1 SIMPL domain-containing protein [Entomomonas asaccharolytica]